MNTTINYLDPCTAPNFLTGWITISLRDLRFSQRRCQRSQSSKRWQCVYWSTDTDISKDSRAFIFRVKTLEKSGIFLPEDVATTILRNRG